MWSSINITKLLEQYRDSLSDTLCFSLVGVFSSLFCSLSSQSKLCLIENIIYFSEKDINGTPTANLKEIHAYARGTLEFSSRSLFFSICLMNLENTDNPNSAHAQQTLKGKPKNWQESLYKLYFQLNRFYKQLTYYAWRFAEIHVYKLVLLTMILVSALRVSTIDS